jgi:outer membrane immunogenic protein
MRTLIFRGVCALSVCLWANAAGWAQPGQRPSQPEKVSTDVAIVFAGELSRPDPSLGSFWFKGGGVDAAVTFWKGFGVAATLTGDHASNIFPGVDENKIAFMAGPRYTFTAWKGHGGAGDSRRLQLFGQGLVGVAHGFDTQFSNGTTGANLLAIETGGGLNFYITRHFGIRPIEVEFVRTQIGATGFSTQNDMRVASGVTYHFGGTHSH